MHTLQNFPEAGCTVLYVVAWEAIDSETLRRDALTIFEVVRCPSFLTS